MEARRYVEGRRSTGVFEMKVRPISRQLGCHLDLEVMGRPMERRLTAVVAAVYIGAAAEQQSNDLGAAHAGGGMQGLVERSWGAAMNPITVLVEHAHDLDDITRLDGCE